MAIYRVDKSSLQVFILIMAFIHLLQTAWRLSFVVTCIVVTRMFSRIYFDDKENAAVYTIILSNK